MLGILVAAMAAPEIVAAAPEWILAHPTEAIVLKAIGEEGAEAALTGTPFDPRNVALDILSQAGDDFMPRRQRLAPGTGIGSGLSYDDEAADASGRPRQSSAPTWPNTPEEMDELLGVEGKRVPDGPTTSGRGKVKWKPSDNLTITYEQHPYDLGAPDFHRLSHWHLSYPGQPHTRGACPGTPIPGDWFRR
jgi:hypothetical protein